MDFPRTVDEMKPMFGTAQTSLKRHSPWWKWQFRREKLLLRLSLRGALTDIDHIGSTAVPGLVAKPIIDIVASVPDFETAFDDVPGLERLGYEFKGQSDRPEHYFFKKGNPVRFHLFIHQGADSWGRVSFRDALRLRPELADQYEVLKRTLAERYPDDIRSYWNGKREFIDQAIRQ